MESSTTDDNYSRNSDSCNVYDFRSTEGSCGNSCRPTQITVGKNHPNTISEKRLSLEETTSYRGWNTDPRALYVILGFIGAMSLEVISITVILITFSGVMIFVLISYRSVGVPEAEKLTKRMDLDRSTASDRRPVYSKYCDSNFMLRSMQSTSTQSAKNDQQIDAILIDLLERLLTEPVSMSQVKLRQDQTKYIWHTVKDLYLSGNLTSKNKLKIMKLAQNTIEIFVEDKTIMDIVISILHNGLPLESEMFQNESNKFLRNMLDFCLQDETESKWRAVEVLICYLFTFKAKVAGINGSYYYLTSKIKTILQSSNTDDSTSVAPSNLKLYLTWLNASDNTDVIHWYAIYAICQLIMTEDINTRLFIIDHINVNHFFDVVNKTGIVSDAEAVYENIRPLLEYLDGY